MLNVSLKNTIAGPTGYSNGDAGPIFVGLTPFPRKSAWPEWKARINSNGAPHLCEGGLRTTGCVKKGTAEKPLISFVTIVRNSQKTIERTIKSVQDQTYTNVEHVVVDGASTDDTLGIIKKYDAKLDYYVSEKDAGLYDALNKAVELALGEIICVLNSDDWLEPNAAQLAADVYKRRKSENLVIFTAAKVMDESKIHFWSPAFVHPGSIFVCPNVCHNGIFASRAAYEASGSYDNQLKIAADSKWILQCLSAGSEFIYTHEPTVNYSLGGTSSNLLKHSIEFMSIIKEKFSFLTDQELHGIYHCFFVFSNRDNGFYSNNPTKKTEFIQNLYVKYLNEIEFINALNWAILVTALHPADMKVNSFGQNESVLKNLAKKALKRTPILFNFAKKVNQRFVTGND